MISLVDEFKKILGSTSLKAEKAECQSLDCIARLAVTARKLPNVPSPVYSYRPLSIKFGSSERLMWEH